MRLYVVSSAIALTGFARLSVQAPTPTADAAAASASGEHYYLQIKTSSNQTQTAWYGFLDPRTRAQNGVALQFTPSKANGTTFNILHSDDGPLLHSIKKDWVAGSSNADNSAQAGAVYLSSLSFWQQGGEPLLNAHVNAKNAAVSLNNTNTEGVPRNHTQTCFLPKSGARDTSLPNLVVGERAFKGCNKVTLILTPAK